MLVDEPGLVIVPTSEVGRFAIFTSAIAGTVKTEGTLLDLRCSASVSENINSSLREAFADHHAWVWIMGDDHVWGGDTLIRMLEILDDTTEADVLVPLVVRRNPPWHPVLAFSEGRFDEHGHPLYKTVQWEQLPSEGVLEVDVAGSAGMLIRRHVIDALEDPWFYSTPDEQGRQAILNEDFTFCRDVTNQGFRIFATVDCVLGHLGIFNVRPLFRQGRWGALTEFSTPEDQFRHMFMPVEYSDA